MVGDTEKPRGFAVIFPCLMYLQHIQSPKTVKMFFLRNPVSLEGEIQPTVQRSSSFFLLVHFLGDILEGPRQYAFCLGGRV